MGFSLHALKMHSFSCQEYLAKKGLVHRDLAACNVFLGEHKTAKVADYYTKRVRKVPFKWMSIEAFFDQKFTTQSDV